MQNPILTVGMPTYDDYDGVFFTIQSLRMHHAEAMSRVELLIIDNNPNGKHGRLLKALLEQVPNGRYIAEGDWRGPWVKDLVVREAAGKYAMCLDCHVLLPTGTLQRLLDFYESLDDNWDEPPTNGVPHPRDFFQGPLLYDSLQKISTHFEPVWRGEMWGIWADDARGCDLQAPPFEIPMQGMGLFTCSKQSWVEVGGFNRLMRGFGGEEGYIHAKFRQANKRCWCLPFLRWMHRFNRPHGVPFELTWQNKVWNYAVGLRETGLTVEPMVAHFMQAKGLKRETIMDIVHAAQRAVDEAAETAEATARCPVLTKERFLEYMFAWMKTFETRPNYVAISEEDFPSVRDWGSKDRPKPDVPESISLLYGCKVSWRSSDNCEPVFDHVEEPVLAKEPAFDQARDSSNV